MRTMSIPQVAVAIPSQGSRRASALQSFGIRKKSEIDIVLDGKDEFIRSYSTFDEIKGHVNIRLDKDTPIDSLNITFQGQANTWVEKMTSISPRTGRATARHVFLRLQQPIDDYPFSEDNIAKAGQTYSILFKFVVPEKVLPFVCTHSVENDNVRAHHHYLPPSIGESMLAGEGSVLMDDLCPSMAKIVYSIKVNVTVPSSKGRTQETISKSVGIRIIPSRPEPPISPPETVKKEGCLRYNFRREKDIRKGLLKLGKKQGRLTAETNQPQSLQISRQQDQSAEQVSTTATINLRYDPVSLTDVPPQLTSIGSRLKAFTHFGAAPYRHLVNETNYDIWSIMHSQYALAVDLSELTLSAVKWTKHDPESPFAERMHHGSTATTASSQKISEVRKFSTSTGTASTDEPADLIGINRTPSNLSNRSNNSYSSATSTTPSSTPESPTMTASNMGFPSSVVSPSTRYDQTLPYYTASITAPITLPSVQNNCSNEPSDPASRRSSLGKSDQPPGSSPSFRKRGIPTFIPTFHSCLIARTYVLELAIHATNPAPQMNLRVPINIICEQPATQLQPPISWYDPFEIANPSDAQDTANDEAIARILGSQTSNPDEQIPSYADLQIQTDNAASYSYSHGDDTFSNRRHNSVPLTSRGPIFDANERPPEYNAPVGFRRRQQSTPLVSSQTTSSQAQTAITETAPSQQRKESTGWTKKLGLRT